MFNCYLHGWSSRDGLCPACATTGVTTDITMKYTDTASELILAKDAEISHLQSANTQLTAALEEKEKQLAAESCENKYLKEKLVEAVDLISRYEKKVSIHTTEKALNGCPKCRHQIYTKKRSLNNPVCECVNCGFIGEDWQFETLAKGNPNEPR